MFARKLRALNHPSPDSININDESSFRNLIVWLEDQAIKNYKIEERLPLKAINSKEWNKAYKQYLGKLDCPINPDKRASVTDWLLGLGIQYAYSEKADIYNEETAANVEQKRNADPKVVTTNPLDRLDFQSADFRDGVNNLATMLNINPHPDHLITLQAVSKLVCLRLSQEALQNPGEIVPKGKAYPIYEADLGFEAGNPALSQAGKALRLLYIHDLRKLQTLINECIVAVQTITADPKTDTKLGKVGR